MKLTTTWVQKSRFDVTDGELTTSMDARPPFGEGTAMSPKQLCLAAIAGCTGVDIASLMKKHRQKLTGLRIDADAPVREGHPATFTHVQLDFHFEGEVEEARALEAVELSQTQYCGVSAMMAAHCPVRYRVWLNGREIGQGEARFAR